MFEFQLILHRAVVNHFDVTTNWLVLPPIAAWPSHSNWRTKLMAIYKDHPYFVCIYIVVQGLLILLDDIYTIRWPAFKDCSSSRITSTGGPAILQPHHRSGPIVWKTPFSLFSLQTISSGWGILHRISEKVCPALQRYFFFPIRPNQRERGEREPCNTQGLTTK